MKKNVIALTLGAAMVMTITAAAAEFSTVEEGKLYMATNAAFPPYEMTTDDGGFEGIDVEIAGAIAEKLGLELVVDDMEFGSTITSVQAGKDDMVMAGLTVTEERKQNIDFTNSYSTGVQVVIVPEDSDIETVDDLADDKMIGCQEGTTGYIYCSDTVENGGYGEDHVVAYTNGAMAVQALLTGKVDAVVIDSNPAKAFVEANEGLKILDTEYVVEDYAIGVSKENPELLEAINNALVELQEDGTVDAIVGKYINADADEEAATE
ncbi:MAG: transporter substrate-binding domain-containing protein [Lachnospiraceae bacterium]|nr:transporter substrate-binding domain-containing protein [Lachnospiraceae bacterium]